MRAPSPPPRSWSNWAMVILSVGVPLGVFVQLDTAPPGTVDPTTLAQGTRVDELLRSHRPVSFSDLGAFVFQPELPARLGGGRAGDPIPPSIRALGGRSVHISGFMLPLDFNGGGVTTFILNANYDMCAYGAPTVLNQQVEVTMAEGRRTVYTHRVIRVFGQFDVGERRENGRVVSLFRMVATALEADVR